METFKAIALRKSTRSYQPRPVEADKIEQLLLAANSAPKGVTVHISVVENAQVLKDLNDVTLSAMKVSDDSSRRSRAALPGYQPLYGAPLLFLLSAPDGARHGVTTAACAAANITIAATALELGSCYVASMLAGLAIKKELSEKIGVPKEYTPVCGVLAGYSAGDAFASPEAGAFPVNYCK